MENKHKLTLCLVLVPLTPHRIQLLGHQLEILAYCIETVIETGAGLGRGPRGLEGAVLVGRMRVSHQVRKKASSARATGEEMVRGKLTLYMVDDMGWVGRKIHHRVWLNFISPHPLAAGTAYSRSIFPCHPAFSTEAAALPGDIASI